MSCTYHYSVQNCFTALNISVFQLFKLPLQKPGKHWSFQIVFFDLAISFQTSSLSFYGLMAHFFLLLNNIVEWIYHSMFIH